MKQKKRQVSIHLHTAIDDNGKIEYNTVQEKGQFLCNNNIDVLMYTEKLNGEKVKNFITIQKDKVTIKRTGVISMNQQFFVGRKTESLYHHPHGNFHMETFTNTMTYKSLQKAKKGHLMINYTVKLNGLDNRNHTLTLTYQEED